MNYLKLIIPALIGIYIVSLGEQAILVAVLTAIDVVLIQDAHKQ